MKPVSKISEGDKTAVPSSYSYRGRCYVCYKFVSIEVRGGIPRDVVERSISDEPWTILCKQCDEME